MFGLFTSPEKKMRESAANWLEVADKVWHYRRDVLTDREAGELMQRTGEVRQQLKARADAGKLKLALEALEPALRRTGGAIYPKTAMTEWVEFLLVAALVIIGVRTYFVQPFKIPTNSMWPTYYGMTGEVFRDASEEPSPLARAFRFAAYGARAHRIDAPADGEVIIPVKVFHDMEGNRVVVLYHQPVSGRRFLVLPTEMQEYYLLVGHERVGVRVPEEFDFTWVLEDAFIHDGGPHNQTLFQAKLLAAIDRGNATEVTIDGNKWIGVHTGKSVRAGDRILSFDELTGDQLFVDRVSYNFVRPSVGSGFVFATVNIHSNEMRDYNTGQQIDQYYIKRLVGLPGDTLEVHEPVLWRNGAPIDGAQAFENNAHRRGPYSGYVALGGLSPGLKVTVPANGYYAMGDNSSNSKDSRYWGFVPYKDAVGRPLFIYYPFSRHWGPAH